jgi:hypothetical protein
MEYLERDVIIIRKTSFSNNLKLKNSIVTEIRIIYNDLTCIGIRYQIGIVKNNVFL